MDEACTYCGCDVTDHSPVVVFEGAGALDAVRSEASHPADVETVDVEAVDAGADDAATRPAGRFCNYGCLAAHVEEAGLASGSACRVDP